MAKGNFSNDLTDLIPAKRTNAAQQTSAPAQKHAQPTQPTQTLRHQTKKTFQSKGKVPKSSMSFYMEDGLKDRLWESAERHGARSVSEYLSFIVEKYLDEEG